MNKKIGNKKKGISLIVLVITIIVIIILAAAVILTLTGNNPIDNAKKATFINDMGTFQDELNMYKTNEYAKSQGSFDQSTLDVNSTNPDLLYAIIPSLKGKTKYLNEIKILDGGLEYVGSNPTKITWAQSINITTPPLFPTVTFGTNGGSNSTIVSTTITVADIGGSGLNASTLQYVWDTQNVTEPPSGWTTFVNGATLTKSGTGIYYLWIKASDNLSNSIVTKSNLFAVGDVDIPVTTIQTEHMTFAGLTTGFSYNNPVIPAGFVAVNTTAASWDNLAVDYNNGLVIQDASGNQFAWVPVDGNNVKYEKWCTTYYSYTITTDDILPTGVASEATQISTYQGFYIARYESGKENTNILVSKKGATVWNYINYIDSKIKAEAMYTGTNVKSGLVTGKMWDTTMKWIKNSGKSVTDCRTWGNYSNSNPPATESGHGILKTAGYSNYWRAKNIYDLAGNTTEWTNEKYSTYPIIRGGNYNDSAVTESASYRDYRQDTAINDDYSFRVALYII